MTCKRSLVRVQCRPPHSIDRASSGTRRPIRTITESRDPGLQGPAIIPDGTTRERSVNRSGSARYRGTSANALAWGIKVHKVLICIGEKRSSVLGKTDSGNLGRLGRRAESYTGRQPSSIFSRSHSHFRGVSLPLKRCLENSRCTDFDTSPPIGLFRKLKIRLWSSSDLLPIGHEFVRRL